MTAETEVRQLYGEIDPRWRKRVRALAQAAAWVVIAGGALGLMGRVLDLPILAQWINRPTVRPMQPATAALFVVGGLSVLTGLLRSGRWWRRSGAFLAAVVVAGGVSVIVANLADLIFPRWLITSFEIEDVIGGERPARPAGNVGFVLATLGLSVILISTRSEIAHVVGQIAALGAAMIGATVVVAFAYGDDSLRGFPLGSGRMEISAALLAIVFCTAVVAARPALGLMAPIISPWPGGIVLRRLLPFVLAGPPAVVSLLLSAATPESQSRWLALTAVILSGILLGALFMTAAAVSRSQQSLELAHDLTDRATKAVGRDAEVVDLLLTGLSRTSIEVEGLEVAVRFRPAEGWLGGDAVITVPLGGSRMAAIVIDVVGHGPHPAIAAFRLGDAAHHSLRSGVSPAAALAQSRWVLDEPHMMASVAIVEIDAASGSVRHASGGSPPLVHMSARGVELYESTGPVLMADERAVWNEGLAVLEHGDVLLIYSDGLADPTSPDGIAVATVDDLVDALDRCPFSEAERIADWCVDEAVGRAEGLVRDDASLIVVRRVPV